MIHCQSPGGADIEAEDDPPVANTNRAAHIHSTDTAVIAVSMKQLDQWTLPSWYQPSKTDLFQQHFTAHFIGNFFNPAAYLTNQNIWAFHLPAVQTSTISPAVKCAIKCATMAFYGTRADNTAMKTEACRWYIKGVQYQRLELEGTSIHGGARNLDVTSVLAPLMFSIFETIMVTSPSGWVQHTHAAIHFLEMIGPQAFQEGLPHSLLRSVRLSAVSLSLSARDLRRCPVVLSLVPPAARLQQPVLLNSDQGLKLIRNLGLLCTKLGCTSGHCISRMVHYTLSNLWQDSLRFTR